MTTNCACLEIKLRTFFRSLDQLNLLHLPLFHVIKELFPYWVFQYLLWIFGAGPFAGAALAAFYHQFTVRTVLVPDAAF